MTRISDDALRMMERFGGRFVKGLMHLYSVADEDNRLILRTAFADTFARYEAMAREHAKGMAA